MLRQGKKLTIDSIVGSSKWLPDIMTKNFLQILEGFQNDEFSLNCPKCQNDEKSEGSIMTKKIIRHYGRSLNKYSGISRTKLFWASTKMRTSCLKKCGPRLKKCGPSLEKCGPTIRDNV